MLCRYLASLLPSGVCESRGEKSVEAVIARARLLGKTRVAFIHGEKGRASEMHLVRVRASSWEWLEPAIKLKSVRFAELPREPPECVVFEGPGSEDWRELLAGEECEDKRDAVRAVCSAHSLKFLFKRKKVIELVFDVSGRC